MTPPAPARPAAASPRTEAMRKGRQADSARRRQRVIATLDRATADGTEITVAGIARAAAVDRAFLYRHRDLLEKIHALEAAPPAAGGTAGPAVTCASLQADLLAAHERCRPARPPASGSSRNACPKHSASRPGTNPDSAPPPTSTPSASKVTHLEQQAIDLRLQLEERDQDLTAARAANRELMAQLNATPRHR